MATTLTSIVDNLGDNTLLHALETRTERGQELCVATAFFSLDALNLLGPKLKDYERIRLLFGNDANPTQRVKLLAEMRCQSDRDLREHREKEGLPAGLQHTQDVIKAGRFEARCYTREKFHAKAYLVAQPFHPPLLGIIGSGNFTRPGLTRNIELNVDLTMDQSSQLREWFEARWEEAAADVVTDQVAQEIKRQIDLYDPYAIYQRALLAWGQFRQGDVHAEETLRIKDTLDPHQEQGYRRALQILQRENGVMVCDGVGLGKSFIALALMEHFCARNKNVLLVAPKSIMESSWNGYLQTYLERYKEPFGSIFPKYMTEFGFEYDEEEDSAKIRQREEELQRLVERADVVVVDESHNFRTRGAQRYQNLFRIVAPQTLTAAHKKVVLMSATPVNTSYQDLGAQLALITHERGTVSGYTHEHVRDATKKLDAAAKEEAKSKVQYAFEFEGLQGHAGAVLQRILESVFMQRRRSTCIALARAVGKDLTFPIREKPTATKYELSDSFKTVVDLAHRRFSPIAAFLKRMQAEYRRAEAAGVEFKPPRMPAKSDGIKLAAFLPEQYRVSGPRTGRTYQVEAFLAQMVFVNTLKQLESSPVAWQGIIQSLGTGLIARLQYVFKGDAAADIRTHLEWLRTPLSQIEGDDLEGGLEEAELAEANGTELDNWLEHAVASRHLHHKLADFCAGEFDVEKWRRHILEDLEYLREIHAETLVARQVPDYKFERAVKDLNARLAKGQRVVVFTQSQRTAFYLERQFSERLKPHAVARIDSNVKQEARDDILYAFCPKYNPKPKTARRKRVDVLICTDVLSEGVNLQEAECILNYDIHWNPVRLIQRIGRVDRRLDPALNPVPHRLGILNFLPPKEIDEIIKLVNTVESRRQIIFNTLGLDQAFFKANDPEGTLKEFNAQVDGEPSLTDHVDELYVRAVANPDPALRQVVEQMPPGAFGVWDKAPADGLFALFEMEASKDVPDQDREHFKGIVGMPVLALKTGTKPSLDAAAILDTLSHTVKGERSGNPSDPAALKQGLRELRNAANQSFREINLPSTFQPRLVCWMQLRRGPSP